MVQANDQFKQAGPVGEAIVYFYNGIEGLGPKLLGVFNEGRIEEFIESKPVQQPDLLTADIQFEIARKLAQFHVLDLPLKISVQDTLTLFENNYKQYDSIKFEQMFDAVGVDVSWIRDFDFQYEINWLRRVEQRISGRLVSCHGDFNKNNILIRDKPLISGDRVVIIDYESISRHYRGKDFGTLFFFAMFEMVNNDFKEYFDYPSLEWRKTFLSEYIKEYQKLKNIDLDTNGLDSIDHLLFEADFYAMYTPLFIFSIVLKQDKDSFWFKLPRDVGNRLWVRINDNITMII